MREPRTARPHAVDRRRAQRASGSRGGRLRLVLAAVAVFAVLAVAGLGHTWVRVERIRLGYELSDVTAEHQTLRRDHERLKLEVATLKAPLRIERLARERLGMRPPRSSQVIVLQDVPDARPDEATVAVPARKPRRDGLLGLAAPEVH